MIRLHWRSSFLFFEGVRVFVLVFVFVLVRVRVAVAVRLREGSTGARVLVAVPDAATVPVRVGV